MKNLLISIMLIQFVVLTAHGQTRYGLGSGSAGVDYSYFGVGSGESLQMQVFTIHFSDHTVADILLPETEIQE